MENFVPKFCCWKKNVKNDWNTQNYEFYPFSCKGLIVTCFSNFKKSSLNLWVGLGLVFRFPLASRGNYVTHKWAVQFNKRKDKDSSGLGILVAYVDGITATKLLLNHLLANINNYWELVLNKLMLFLYLHNYFIAFTFRCLGYSCHYTPLVIRPEEQPVVNVSSLLWVWPPCRFYLQHIHNDVKEWTIKNTSFPDSQLLLKFQQLLINHD